MLRRMLMLATLVLTPGLASIGQAAPIIQSAVSATDLGAPSTFSFNFASPYVGGPFDAAALSFGSTLIDRAGNGASLTGSLIGKVDGTPVITLPLSCSLGAGAAGAIAPCPAGAGASSTAAAAVTTGDGGLLTQRITFSLGGGGDTATFVGSAVLSGGDSTPMVTFAVAVTDFGAPSTFSFSFTLPFLGRHSALSASLMGAVMDSTGNGASVTGLDLDTEIDGAEVLGVDISGACAFGPGGALAVESCLAGIAFAPPTTVAFAAPPSGTMSMELEFTLSGDGDAAGLLSGFRIFNAATEVVPGPTALLALVAGLAVAAVRVRRRAS